MSGVVRTDVAGLPGVVTTDHPVEVIRYTDINGQPDPAAKETSVDGTAYVCGKPGLTQLMASGAISAGPREVLLVRDAVFLVELQP